MVKGVAGVVVLMAVMSSSVGRRELMLDALLLMKTSPLLMHLYQYKYQFLVPLLALVLVNSTIR
jgi:hypothetical protein